MIITKIRSKSTKNEFGAIRKLPNGKYQANFINLTWATHNPVVVGLGPTRPTP
jgi:hypothetical protein